MSNRVTIEPTEFKDLRDGSVTRGFRAYDDFAQTYSNNMESIPEDDKDFLAIAMKNGDTILNEMLSFCVEQEKGLYIGGNWYDYSEVKDILSELE